MTFSNRAALLAAYETLPDSAIVDETTAAAVRNKAVASLQRERWAGTGPNYVKDGARVGYRKRDLTAWLRERVVSPSNQAA